MATRHDDNDGSDIFWPGYVDATTNLILNLLFLLTILIVAVFMFALELGRMSKVESDQPNKVETEIVSERAPVTADERPLQVETVETTDTERKPGAAAQAAAVSREADFAEENFALKREIQRLNALLAQQSADTPHGGGETKTIDATIPVSPPQTGIDRTLATDAEVTVHFKDEAIAFTPAEHAQLQESLQPIVAAGQARIFVEVPAGFSEAKRLGFYRAMAVRNLLLEIGMPKEDIEVLVVEGRYDANASRVKVRPR